MPNFDALRTGNLGPLAYLGRKIVIPSEVQGIWTLNGTLNDLSTYERHMAGSVTYTDGDFSGTQGAKVNATVTGISLADFTLDWLEYRNNDYFYQSVTLGDYNLYTDSTGSTTYRLREGTTNKYQGINRDTWFHYAVVRSGSTLCWYVNGSRVYTGTTSETAITALTFACYGKKDVLSNVRLLSTALTTGLTFPTPSGLYTGYEPLNGGGVILPRSSKFTPRPRRFAPVAVMGGRA